MDTPLAPSSPFVFLTFLAAPAILTNASTVLALSTLRRGLVRPPSPPHA